MPANSAAIITSSTPPPPSANAPLAGPTAPAAIILTNILRTFVGLAVVDGARAGLAASPFLSALLSDLLHCCSLERAPLVLDAALLCLAHMCSLATLQKAMLEVREAVGLVQKHYTPLPPSSSLCHRLHLSVFLYFPAMFWCF